MFIHFLSLSLSLGFDYRLFYGKSSKGSRELPGCVSESSETSQSLAGLWAARRWWTGLSEEWHHHSEHLLFLSSKHVNWCLVFVFWLYFCVYFQIISQKDEHCWVGELNGLRGELRFHYNKHWTFVWFSEMVLTIFITYIQHITPTSIYHKPFVPLGWFPAKFVEVLDERSKEVIALLLDCVWIPVNRG